MENVKTAVLLGIVILILSSFIVLASCTPAASVIETTAVASTTTAPTTTTIAPPTTTTAAPTTTIATKPVYIPIVGWEFPTFNREQDKWIITQFDYDTIHEPMSESDWYFPWSLTIKNKTETDLELIVYIVYVGYHEWIGHITKTSFMLKGGEIKTLSGEDILSDALVEQIAYIREANLEPYVAER